jgi:hypothetical protein
MADVEWAVVCDYAFQDSGRKTCLIGIFDRVFAQSVPTTLNRSSLAAKIVGEPKETAQLKIEIVRPTGGVLATLGGPVELGENGVVEVQMAIQGLPLPDWGPYAFNIHIGDDLAKTLGVSVAKPPAPGPAPSQG